MDNCTFTLVSLPKHTKLWSYCINHMKAVMQRTICANTGNITLRLQRVASHFSDWATAANTKPVLFSENVLCIITSINLRKLISHRPVTYPFDITRCRDVALTSIHTVGVSTWRHRTETQTKSCLTCWVTFHIRPTRRGASYALNSDGKCFILAQQPPSGQGPPHSRGFLITLKHAPLPVGLLWTSDQVVAETST